MKIKDNMFIKLIDTNLKAIYRQKMAFFFTIIFPLIFIAVFGISYSGTANNANTMEIVIINTDTGIPENTIAFYGEQLVSGTFYSEKYVKLLDELIYPDSKDNTTLFSLQVMNHSEYDNAMFKLERRDIVAIVLLPENFSLGVLSSFKEYYHNNTELASATNNWEGYPDVVENLTITVEGDASLQEFAVTGTIIREFSDIFFQLGNTDQQTGVQTNIKGSYATKGFTGFHYIVPGVIIFGVLQSLTSSAGVTMRDVESKTLERIRLTRVPAKIYVLALIVSQAILVSIQVPIMFGTAIVFGIEPTIHVLSGILVGVILSFATTGIAFLLAGLAGGSQDAEGLANLIAVPMTFLSGGFSMMPNPELITNIAWLGGYSFRMFDILPSTPAIRILRSIILGQRTLQDNWFDLGLLAVLSITYLVLGLIIYTRKHFRPK